jgi:hypothetical protein
MPPHESYSNDKRTSNGRVMTYQATSSLTHHVSSRVNRIPSTVSPPHILHHEDCAVRRCLTAGSQTKLLLHSHREKWWPEQATGTEADERGAALPMPAPSPTCSKLVSTLRMPRFRSRMPILVRRSVSLMRRICIVSCWRSRSACVRGGAVGASRPCRVSSSISASGFSGGGVRRPSSELIVSLP